MYPYSTEALFVAQPFGCFVVTSLPARLLLDTCYSDRLKAIKQEDESYELVGSQRRLDDKRLKDIGGFIDTGAASFPNSIILAANYSEENGLEVLETDDRWTFQMPENGNLGKLLIPSSLKASAIIDGQHRLFGFNFCKNLKRLDMHLVCAIFFDLPKPYQARLFATINANQRPVNKSQTYELFGYNLEKEPAQKWTPDKLAVFMTRKLNADNESPLCGHVLVPAENTFSMTASEAKRAGEWVVSLATIVEGILRLISSNPKRDAIAMAGEERYVGHNREVLEIKDADNSPLRSLFVDINDELIYITILNYFKAVDEVLWRIATPDSFIKKTVGIQALFDIARPLIASGITRKDVSTDFFINELRPTKRIDFSAGFFHASGSGRTKIRKCLELSLGLQVLQKEDRDYSSYRDLVNLTE